MSRKPSSISRRKAVGILGSATAGMLLGRASGVLQASPEASGGPLSVSGQEVELQITPVSHRAIRLSLLPVVSGKVQPIRQGLVLVPGRWPPPSAKIRTAKGRELAWGERRISVSAHPLRIVIVSSHGKTIQQFEIDSQSGAVRFSLGHAPIYGLGESGKQFDRRGYRYSMTHGQNVPDVRLEGARIPVPWLLGTEGWGLLFHLPRGTFDLIGPQGQFQPRPGQSALPLDAFLVVGDQPSQIVAEYARLTGFPHMPPVWALGYQQSHRTLSSRHEVMSELQTFREKKLPCDVMIYLGTGFCPSGWNLGHGSYEFNSKVFSDPKKMIAEMHREHFRIVLHEDKPPKKLHGSVTDTGAAAADPEDAAAYWKKHLEIFGLGVDGWWADEGDWLDDVECLVRNRMYWKGAIQARPNVRPYTLNRNGYAGAQRYGWIWSGDIESRWAVLRDQITSGINTGLSGIPYWGTDTGGFITTPELTGELYVRWFQFSAFCPLFRSHGRTWKLRLPWGWDTGSYGPIEGPVSELPPVSDLHNPDVEPICRKYLDLRYRLMPYLYTAVRESHDTGLPLMRALWLHYPRDPRAVVRGDEYLWGPDLLVAPVVEQGAKSRKLYLPQGTWYDFWTDAKIKGAREVTRPVDLATIPLYVRAGSILPFGPVEQYADEEPNGPLVLKVYPGANGDVSLYEDDGISFNYQKGDYARLEAAWDDSGRRLSLRCAKGPKWSGPAKRHLEIRLAGGKNPQNLFFDGSPRSLQL
jgi:alpha-glucosidase (family GH31 glycosyl hydrolase)